ncbi:quinolinate synthase NadA [Candidatus Margulisiibacteriota bacterium]
MDYAKEIQKLKKEQNAILLVHNYQRPEIQDIADILGDSLGLAKEAAVTKNDMIVFCGVKFMAETAKILSPDKLVVTPRIDATCPMAHMITEDDVLEMKKKYPNAVVVSYVNTTAEVKAVTDVCCTSANAVKVVQNVKAQQIIFTPDKNLAAYVQRFTDKQIIPWEGYCYVHQKMRKEEIIEAKKKYPEAVVLVHPECDPEVIDSADEVLSTSGMVKFAKVSNKKQFLIGTEEGLIYRLKKENPDKEFYSAGTAKTCLNMKKITIEDVYNALKNKQYEITLPDDIMKKAKNSLDEMLKYI